MTSMISVASNILRELEPPKIADSLHATFAMRNLILDITQPTKLNGKSVCDLWVPIGYGVNELNRYRLSVFAQLLNVDNTFTLADMYFKGASGRQIAEQAEKIPDCTFNDSFVKGELLLEDIGG
jgi:hypothetical protein